LKPNVSDVVRSVVESPPSRGARIETSERLELHQLQTSPPSRGARIETMKYLELLDAECIAPFTGGAD